MRTRSLSKPAALIFSLLALSAVARAQSEGAPKFEIGVQYSSLSINLPKFGGTENAAGVGARVTYNFNDYFAAEAEGTFYPTGLSSTRASLLTGGRVEQAQFGVKAGRRFRRFGLFAKARPGFVSFGDTESLVEVASGGTTTARIIRERKTHFSMDVGGVLEFYPSRRVLVRFDAGDTIIRYGGHRGFLPSLAIPVRVITGPVPGETRHNFQFNAGVGFRFGGGGDEGAPPSKTGERVRRFELGVQFSSLALSLSPGRNGPSFARSDEGSQVEVGVGARAGFNATNNLAFEAEGTFYTRERLGFDNTAGGWPAQFQAGVKYGRRFERFGLFAKARPGFVTFSDVTVITGFDTFGTEFLIPVFDRERKTYFSMDVGGVLELYPTERILTRFDFGDTMIRYGGGRARLVFPFSPTTPLLAGEVSHNFQFTAGLGFRF